MTSFAHSRKNYLTEPPIPEILIAHMEKCLLALLAMSLAVVVVHGQDPEGFISIDCGGTDSFVDDATKLKYTCDDQYIDTGVNAKIASNYKSSIVVRTFFNLRSFPSGSRNCYSLKPVVRNSTYLIRVAFFHGNYDSHFGAQSKTPILFDLYIGASKWKTVNITDPDFLFLYEAITAALAEVLYVCLVNTGQGTPFISLLEMRPMNSPLYPYVDETQFADLYGRCDFGGSKLIRYPDDKYDRIWVPLMLDEWTNISTRNKVDANFRNSYSELPSVVLQTAVIPSRSAPNSSNLNLSWTQQDGVTPPFVANFHFAEVKQLPLGSRREFKIYYNGKIMYDRVNPKYLEAKTIYNNKPVNMPSNLNQYGFTLNATSNSTEPALMNAFEIFSILSVNSKLTDPVDTDGILLIKTEYKVNKGWTGDPCAPVNYTWVGVGCDYAGNSSKVISLNLSNSGLIGSISPSFFRLQNIKILDLSNNSLNGTIPNFLGTMNSLQILILSGNSFSCPIPDMLQKKSNSGRLLLMTDNKCTEKTSQKPGIPIIGLVITVIAAVVLLLNLVFIVLVGRRYMKRVQAEEQKITVNTFELQLKTQKFTKAEIEKFTENFKNEIGRGGFGSVFYGSLKNGTRVAVKKLTQSKSSKQGPKEFRTELEKLATLHHKNLLLLIGYCEDVSCLALVYEYMAQGTLEDHIRGNQQTLSWRERLRIAIEAAQGLEYMHTGCEKPIVHRDVKSSNILLGENLEAKVSDLGIARAFRSNDEATYTAPVGTFGYIDPESMRSNMITVKCDVYSFGIVLLELITGLPPIIPGECHLMQHVRQQLQSEGIMSLIDRRLEGEYDVNSVQVVLDLAKDNCTVQDPIKRPTMSRVVAVLKESLDLETHRVFRQRMLNENIGMSGRMNSDTDSRTYFTATSGNTWPQSENTHVPLMHSGSDVTAFHRNQQ